MSVSEFKEMARAQNEAEEEPEEEEEGVEVMTRAQLRETAERHNLDFEQLLRDAEARGITIRGD